MPCLFPPHFLALLGSEHDLLLVKGGYYLAVPVGSIVEPPVGQRGARVRRISYERLGLRGFKEGREGSSGSLYRPFLESSIFLFFGNYALVLRSSFLSKCV